MKTLRQNRRLCGTLRTAGRGGAGRLGLIKMWNTITAFSEEKKKITERTVLVLF
jgi:hypothetical protein